MLRLEQVAGLQDHRLGFVEDRQIEYAGPRAGCRVAVDAAQLVLDRLDDGVEELVAHFEHHVQIRKVLRAEHVVDFVENRLHLIVYAHQIHDLLLRQPFVVVVDVSERRTGDVDQRLGHLREVIRHLHVEVPGVDVALLQAAQRRHDAVFAVAGLFEEPVRRLHHLLEHLAVLLENGDQRPVVNARHLLHRRAYFADADAEHFVRSLGLDYRQFLRGSFLLRLGAVAADEQPCAESDERRDGDPAAPEQQQRHAEGDQESAERGDEPPRNDGHDARDAVYGAFAAPRPVCER